MSIFSLSRVLITLCLASLTSCVAITGASGGINTATGQRPSRQEFSTFRISGPAFDLYILSLQKFQQQNQTALLSYYQVAGVHGHPYIAWDDVQGPYQAGYCTHQSILFPSWHRPYVALYEQILSSIAQQIASTYPPSQRGTYQAAANTFRIPYWDWALNVTMPDPVNDPMISVNTPHGGLNMVNPLYNYTFHPQPSASDFPPQDALSKYHSTVRYPDANGLSQSGLANAQLQANAAVFLGMTYQLLASESSYASFSNTGYSEIRYNSYNSIENMHNGIHTLVGNGGHMAIIPFSAFDPIFWLHHANVDRLFAIWQAIYPDSYTTPEVNIYGTQTIAPGATDDINSPLTPFHSDNAGTFYTSATVRSTRTFGYSYPEVVDWNVNATQLSSNVRANVNMLYNPTGSISQSKARSLRPRYSNMTHEYTNTTNATTDYQYFINVRVDKSALSRPFFIHFFLGSPPTSPSTWSFAPNLIGSHSILYYPSSSPNFNTTFAKLAYGQIPLDHALSPITTDLCPDNIVPLLKKELIWRVQDLNDEVVEVAAVNDLQIFVVAREVIKHGGGGEKGDEFPVYGELNILRKATDGKVGGLDEDKGM